MPIATILDRAARGATLSEAEALALFALDDAAALRDLYAVADQRRAALAGDEVTYVRNRNLNFTNVCITNCTFCGFKRNKQDADSYTLDTEQMLRKIEEALSEEITEVCIQGGLNPELKLDYYCALVREVKAHYPDIHVHAFSPQEIQFLIDNNEVSLTYVLSSLKEAGVDSLPGTAAEILRDAMRLRISPRRLMTAQWVEIITTAHRVGLPTTSTMMYGHLESAEDIVEHYRVLRHIQLDTGGITEFVPMAFVPFTTHLGRKHEIRSVSSQTLTFKVYAIARLYFQELMVNLQTSWVKLGLECAVESVRVGVNDLGGTLLEENITRLAGGQHGQRLDLDKARALLAPTGRPLVQRDTLYRRVPANQSAMSVG